MGVLLPFGPAWVPYNLQQRGENQDGRRGYGGRRGEGGGRHAGGWGAGRGEGGQARREGACVLCMHAMRCCTPAAGLSLRRHLLSAACMCEPGVLVKQPVGASRCPRQ